MGKKNKKRNSKLKKAGHLIGFLSIRLFTLILRPLPHNVRLKTARRIGNMMMVFHIKARKRALNNLAYIMPQLTHEEREKVARKVGGNFVANLAELLNNDKLAQMVDHVTINDRRGLDALIMAKAEGRGAIILSGHYGQWEIIRHYLKSLDMEVGAVYKPNSNPYYEKLFVKNIALGGKPIFPTGARGMTSLVRHLKGGGFAAILTDQRYKQAPKLDFLGKPARTSLAAGDLAQKYNLLVIPSYAERSDSGYTIDFEAPITDNSSINILSKSNTSLEKRILNNPENWYWLHNRWGKRP